MSRPGLVLLPPASCADLGQRVRLSAPSARPAPVVYIIRAGGVAVVDTRTREVVDTLLGGGGSSVAVDPSTGVVYETNSAWGSVSVFPARD